MNHFGTATAWDPTILSQQSTQISHWITLVVLGPGSCMYCGSVEGTLFECFHRCNEVGFLQVTYISKYLLNVSEQR